MAAKSKTRASTPRLSDVARHVVIPSGIETTSWPKVEAKLLELGIVFFLWQKAIAMIALGKRADGKYAATVGGIVLSIPRQVGKTFLVGSLLFALCLIYPRFTVLWTAHRTRTSTKTFQSMQRLAKRKKIAPFVRSIRTGHGEQEIEFTNGSVIMFGAREFGFGRGLDEVDAEVFDEAQILTDKSLEDMVAATNQSRHPHGALLFFIGTPPRPEDPGDAFAFKREQALAGDSEDTVYVEFSADADADADDVAQWRKANPSYPDQTSHEAMLRLRKNLPSEASWRREALGIWTNSKKRDRVFNPEDWRALKVPLKGAPKAPAAAFAVTASHDRIWYVGCAVPGERVHLELALSEFVVDSTDIEDRIVEKAGRRIPVAIDEKSPAASIIPNLKKRGVRVVVVYASDQPKACLSFDDALRAGRLSHLGEDAIDEAVVLAEKRHTSEAGGWAYKRSPELLNAPLEAVTLAHYALQITKTANRSGRNYESTRSGEVV